MNWEAIGAIGDFVSGTVVLLTVAYLVVQARQTNLQLRIAALDRLEASGARVRELLITHPDVAELYDRGTRDLAAVEPSELLRFNLHMQDAFAVFQLSYHRHRISGTDGLGRKTRVLPMPVLEQLLTRPGARAWWKKRRNGYGNDPEFGEVVDALIREQEALAAQQADEADAK